MTLPASGAISMSQVNTELALSSTAQSFNDSAVRTLAGVPSGAISLNDLHGKIGPPTTIGQAYGGGYYAGKISTTANGVATHYLIVSDKSVGQWHTCWYYVTEHTSSSSSTPVFITTGFTSLIDGPGNTAGLYALNSTYYIAALICDQLNAGGYTDWYLPAKNELEVLYYFLKPDTVVNVTNSGLNANAVSPEPISTNYTTGSPAQTSATAFRAGAGSQEFAGYNYWSSTEAGGRSACFSNFHNGSYGTFDKNAEQYVRAARQIAI